MGGPIRENCLLIQSFQSAQANYLDNTYICREGLLKKVLTSMDIKSLMRNNIVLNKKEDTLLSSSVQENFGISYIINYINFDCFYCD